MVKETLHFLGSGATRFSKRGARPHDELPHRAGRGAELEVHGDPIGEIRTRRLTRRTHQTEGTWRRWRLDKPRLPQVNRGGEIRGRGAWPAQPAWPGSAR